MCSVETFFEFVHHRCMNERKEVRGKVPMIEQVAELGMRLGQHYLADYGARTSRHDFTQRVNGLGRSASRGCGDFTTSKAGTAYRARTIREDPK